MNNQSLSANEKINELLKLYVDAYLERKNIIDSTTDLKRYGLENERGKIYTNQILVLQTMIQEELGIFGLDLAKLLQEKNIEFKPGELSSLEQEYINNKVNNMIAFVKKEEELRNKKSGM